MSQKKPFDLTLLQRALAPMPFVVIGPLVILVTAIETAELAADGSLMICFISGQELTLNAEQATALEAALQEGYSRALAAAATRNAQQLGIIRTQ